MVIICGIEWNTTEFNGPTTQKMLPFDDVIMIGLGAVRQQAITWPNID